MHLSSVWFQVTSPIASWLDPDNIICSTSLLPPRLPMLYSSSSPPTQPVAYLYPVDSSKEPSEAPQTSVCMTTHGRFDPFATQLYFGGLRQRELRLQLLGTPEMHKNTTTASLWKRSALHIWRRQFAAAAFGCREVLDAACALVYGMEVLPYQIKRQKYTSS